MRVIMNDVVFVPIAGLYGVYGLRQDVRFAPRLDLKLLGREIVVPRRLREGPARARASS